PHPLVDVADPLSLIRCGGPSATRTRTAAKRALSFPFVPVRQVMFRHLASASISSAAHREDVRNVPLTGTAASGNRPDHLHIGRIYLEVPRDTDCPSKFASCEPPGGTARSAHNRRPLRRSQSAHRPRWHDRSPPQPSPVSFVPFDIRPELPLAPTEPACSSNSREETAATPADWYLASRK